MQVRDHVVHLERALSPLELVHGHRVAVKLALRVQHLVLNVG